jgi:hypothetical protein
MSTSGGTGTVVAKTTHVTAAQIGTLWTAPITLVAAPGAGFAIVPDEIVGEFVAGVDGFAAFPSPVVYYAAAADLHQITALGECFPALAPPTDALFIATAFRPSSANTYMGGVARNQALILSAGFGDAANPDRAGPIVTTTLQAGGALYAPNDTGTIDTDPNGYVGGAAYKVLTVDGGGAVLTYQITAAGDGYSTTSNPLPTTVGGGQPGVGSGFTVNVTAIHAADGDLYVTTYYRVVATH